MRKRWLLSMAVLVAALALLLWPKKTARRTAPPPESQGTAGISSSPPPIRAAALAGHPTGRVVLHAAWGSAPGQLGRHADPEAPREGPMALAAGHGGDLYVLDQANGRVQRFRDGKPAGEIKVGSDTLQDLAVDKKGDVAVLDRLADKDVALYGPDGQPRGRVPVVGGPITEGGSVTGLYYEDDGVWLGREHVEVVHIADSDGKADPNRPTQPGPPSRDGRDYLWARLSDRQHAAVRLYDHDARIVWQRLVAFPQPILSLLLLDSDLRGHLYLAALADQPPATLVLRLDELSGADAGALILPADPGTIESFRSLTVSDDGTIYQMLLTDAGVTVTSYVFP